MDVSVFFFFFFFFFFLYKLTVHEESNIFVDIRYQRDRLSEHSYFPNTARRWYESLRKIEPPRSIERRAILSLFHFSEETTLLYILLVFRIVVDNLLRNILANLQLVLTCSSRPLLASSSNLRYWT